VLQIIWSGQIHAVFWFKGFDLEVNARIFAEGSQIRRGVCQGVAPISFFGFQLWESFDTVLNGSILYVMWEARVVLQAWCPRGLPILHYRTCIVLFASCKTQLAMLGI